jgi:hypothetical protein
VSARESMQLKRETVYYIVVPAKRAQEQTWVEACGEGPIADFVRDIDQPSTWAAGERWLST